MTGKPLARLESSGTASVLPRGRLKRAVICLHREQKQGAGRPPGQRCNKIAGWMLALNSDGR